MQRQRQIRLVQRRGRSKITLYHPETGQGMFIGRQHRHAVSAPQVFLRRVMTSATCHSIQSFRIAGRIRLRSSRVGAIPIETPLLHIAVHIIQPERIGFCLPHSQRNRLVVTSDPLLLLHLSGQAIPGVEGIGGTRPTSIFPFRFGRQTIALPLLFTQPFTKGYRLLITDIDNRLIIRQRDAIRTSQCPMLRTERFKLRIGHLCLAHPKSMGNSHPMNRCLVIILALTQTALIEMACWDFNRGQPFGLLSDRMDAE